MSASPRPNDSSKNGLTTLLRLDQPMRLIVQQAYWFFLEPVEQHPGTLAIHDEKYSKR
jgi:hypothetical protein